MTARRPLRSLSMRLRVGAFIAILGLTAASCGGGEGSDGATEVTFLTHWAPEQVEMLEQAARTYAQNNPDVTIEVQAVPFANLLSTLRTRGASPNGPTIASVYDLWLAELVRDGLAAPAPEDHASDVQENWSDNLVSGVAEDGDVYGYPNEVNLYALNYNKELFADAGISQPPETWDELVTVARELTARDGDRVTQQGFGVITSWPAGVVHPWLSLVYSNGGALLEGGEPQLTAPNVQAATELYGRMIQEGLTSPPMSQANANTTGPYLDNFANGNTAMLVMANWWKGNLEEAMGDRFDQVGVAPIPVGPNGEGPSAVSYSWLTMVNANATDPQQQAAWEFLGWLNGPDSGAEGSSAMGDILMSMGILPSRTSDLDAHEEELSGPFLEAYVEQLPEATPFPVMLGGEQLTQAIQGHIESVVFGEAEPAAAMQAAQQEVASVLEQAGG